MPDNLPSTPEQTNGENGESRDALSWYKAIKAGKDFVSNYMSDPLNELSQPPLSIGFPPDDHDNPDPSEERDAVREAKRQEYELRLLAAENRAKELDNEATRLENEQRDLENELRRTLGLTAIKFVAGQLIVCDTVFALYVNYAMNMGWHIPNEVIIGWMAASLVEIIGILWVIARSLFPFRDRHRDRDAESKGRGER